jgi:lipoate-protein ligase A
LRFRLLVDGPKDAATNMAVDEALYLTALSPVGVATLRLYRFHPRAVSFGYRQPLHEAIDPQACQSLGIDWVRRPTGGRALLHDGDDELTYSVTAPALGPFGGLSVRGVYDLVSAAIRRALESVGARLDPPLPAVPGLDHREPHSAPCLAVLGRHEIAARGRKLVASAQRRSHRAFLQHGSILRRVDPALWSRISPSNASVPLHAIGLDELVPGVSDGGLTRALREAFEETLGAPASLEGLTSSETGLLPRLIEKYRSSAWTVDRRRPDPPAAPGSLSLPDGPPTQGSVRIG